MDYSDLKKEVLEIAEIAQAVPDPFRDRCFELLLEHLLSGDSQDRGLGESLPAASGVEDGVESESEQHQGGEQEAIPVTSKLRVLKRTGGFSDEDLSEILMMSEGEAHFIKEPTTDRVATGQLEWSLLLVLKNAIESDRAEVDAEEVRSICQEKGFYDSTNFSANFKNGRFASAFKSQLEPQGESQCLSNDGSKLLGDLVKKLAAGS